MMTNRKHLLAGLILLTILVTACGQSEQAAPAITPPTEQEVRKTTPQTPQPEPVRVTENTRQTYQRHCTQCHGSKGKGDSINAKLVTVPPRIDTNSVYLETRTVNQLFDSMMLLLG
ncbi:MAG: hypothetical protein H8E42_06540, partial [Nitrospinae bacterium]|nr:hypothetical protein [Nitrospinota bacterium]